MPADRPDLDSILCGRCGYPLDEVLGEPACPECGRLISESIPAYRTGSPWQRHPGVAGWLATAAAMVRWQHLFDRVTPRPERRLLALNLVLAGTLVAMGYLVPDVQRAGALPGPGWGGVLGAFLLLLPIAVTGLWMLTAIEAAGLRFFGDRRGGRVTRPIAQVVVAHASFGWVVAGALSLVGGWLGQTVLYVPVDRVTGGWLIDVLRPHVLVGGLGFFLGLVIFETLSYLGLTRCRFANPEHQKTEPSVDHNV
ncbi:MAG: zinc ribbon domain-containing protein [Planctomycetota bacterium]